MAIWQTARPETRGPSSTAGWAGPSTASGPPIPQRADRAVGRVHRRARPAARLARASDRGRIVRRPGRPRAGHPRGGRRGRPSASAGDDLSAFVRRTVTNAYTTAEQLANSAGRTGGSAARYPDCELGRHLELVARSIKAGAAGAGLLHDPIRLRYARGAVADSGAVARRLRAVRPRLPGRPGRRQAGRWRAADGLQRIRPAPRRERIAWHGSRDGGAGFPRRLEGQGRPDRRNAAARRAGRWRPETPISAKGKPTDILFGRHPRSIGDRPGCCQPVPRPRSRPPPGPEPTMS